MPSPLSIRVVKNRLNAGKGNPENSEKNSSLLREGGGRHETRTTSRRKGTPKKIMLARTSKIATHTGREEFRIVGVKLRTTQGTQEEWLTINPVQRPS